MGEEVAFNEAIPDLVREVVPLVDAISEEELGDLLQNDLVALAVQLGIKKLEDPVLVLPVENLPAQDVHGLLPEGTVCQIVNVSVAHLCHLRCMERGRKLTRR